MISLRLDKAVNIVLLVVLLLGTGNVFLLFFSQQRAQLNEDWVIHTHEVIQAATKLLSNLQDAETGQRGYLLTLNEDYLAPYHEGVDSAHRTLSYLIDKTDDNNEQQKRLSQLTVLIAEKFVELEQTIELAKTGNFVKSIEVVNSGDGKDIMDEIRLLVADAIVEERYLLDVRQQAHIQYKSATQALILTSSVILIAIILIATLVMKRRVVKPILQLTDATQNYRHGEEIQLHDIKADGEVRQLVKSINTLSAEINNYITELEEARENSEMAAKVKSIFLANMSHEVRTPMNGVYGSLQLLEEITTERGKRILQQTNQSTKSLIVIVNDILDFSKIEAGKLNIEYHPFNLPELLELLNSDFYAQAVDKGIQFKIENNVSNVGWIGDFHRIKQVLINVVSNAIKFTSKGHVIVQVDLVDEGKNLRFVVEDTGIGMNQQALNKLFVRFEQADNSTTRKFGGTGLGMAITHSLVELMGGELSAESELEQGTSISVLLPLEPTELEKVTEQETQQFDFEDKSILFAEDNPVNRMITQEMLKSTNVKLYVANDGNQALELFNQNQVDLVLTDIQMPGTDGLEVCEYVKSQSSTMPVIAITANVMAEDQLKYRKIGFDGFIGKPMEKQALLQLLAKFLISKH